MDSNVFTHRHKMRKANLHEFLKVTTSNIALILMYKYKEKSVMQV